MFKAILYYLLLILEFVMTMFIAGFALGIYLAHSGGNIKADIVANSFSYIFGFYLLAIIVVWFTFHKAKFSKFSWGKVAPEKKWKAMLYTTLPIFGFTLSYYSVTQLLGISINMSQLRSFGYVYTIPFMVFGSFLTAYVYYGAILEELIKCGKKKWVALLTLILMVVPISLFAISDERFGGAVFLIDVLFSTWYGFYAYWKTRSSIILFVLYVAINLIPFNLGPTPLCIALGILGLAMMFVGGKFLRRHGQEMLVKEDDDFLDSYHI